MNEVESAVGIDDLHDGHGAHKEEENLAGLSEMMEQTSGIVSAVAHAAGVESPADNTHKQCGYGFVDLQHTLKCDAQIAEDKKRDNSCYHF